MSPALLNIDMSELAELCKRWGISEISMFGSMARHAAGPDSDVDLVVTLPPDAHWSLLDHQRVKLELERMTGRRVDLLTRRAIEHSHNALRRREILSTLKVLYAA
ncbi:MAG: nucleotidyltransferase domain-containing protein [Pseudomonadota bacterium]